MSDLISRLSEIRSHYNCFNEKERKVYHALSEAIEALEEQRTGKWIKIKKHHYGTYHDFDYYTIRCSVCGNRPEKAWHLTPFCPNCGSRMENGGEDD